MKLVLGFVGIWVGILVVSYALVLFSLSGYAVRQTAEVLAKMPPEQRVRALRELSTEQRELVLKELEKRPLN